MKFIFDKESMIKEISIAQEIISTKKIRKIKVRGGRLRQIKKLIPNTYIMKIYTMEGKYVKTVLIHFDPNEQVSVSDEIKQGENLA